MYAQAEGSINRAHRHVMTLSAICATVRPSEYRPTIDTKGVDPAQYEREVAECQTLARQINQEQSAANAGAAANFNGVNSGTIFFAPPPTDSGDGAGENAA